MECKGDNQGVVSLFDKELAWWTEVYREEMPCGFFSFEMRRRRERVVELLGAQIATMRNPRVLECGCGPGDVLERLSEFPCRLTGLDINPRYLELAAQKSPAAILRQGDLERLPFADAAFDVVYAVGVLMYLQNDRQAIAEISRVVRPGGIVLISVPNHFTLSCLLDPYYFCRPFLRRQSGEGKEIKIRRYRLGQMHELFCRHGVRPIASHAVSFGPWRFWRRELLPLPTAISLSEQLRRLSERLGGGGLKHFSSHWITVMRREESGSAAGLRR